MAIDVFNQEGTGLANGADNADEMKQGVDQGIDTGRQAYDIGKKIANRGKNDNGTNDKNQNSNNQNGNNQNGNQQNNNANSNGAPNNNSQGEPSANNNGGTGNNAGGKTPSGGGGDSASPTSPPASSSTANTTNPAINAASNSASNVSATATEQVANQGTNVAVNASSSAATTATTTAGTTASTTAAGAAAGSAAPGIGTAIGAAVGVAWSLKDEIFKVFSVIFALNILFLMSMQSAPSQLYNNIFGTDAREPKEGATLESEYDELEEDIRKVLVKGHDSSLSKAVDMLKDYGITITQTDLGKLVTHAQEYITVGEGENMKYVNLSDTTQTIGYGCDAAMVMCAYAVSQNNVPYTFTADEPDVTDESPDLSGTNKKDMLKKFKRQKKNMYKVTISGPNTIRVPVTVTVTEQKTRYVATTIHYTSYPYCGEIVSYDSRLNKKIVLRNLYNSYEPYEVTKTITEPTDVPIFSEPFAVDCYFDGIDEVISVPGFCRIIGYRTVTPDTETYDEVHTETVQQDVPVYTIQVNQFNEDCVYDAFGLVKLDYFQNTEKQNWQIVQAMEESLLGYLGRDITYINAYSANTAVSETLLLKSKNGVRWYVIENSSVVLNKIPDANKPTEYKDDFVTDERKRIDKKIDILGFFANFDITDYPHATIANTIDILGKGYVSVSYTGTDEEGNTVPRFDKLFSSEYFTIRSDNFISPFYKYSYATINDGYGPSRWRKSGFHGGVDMGAYLNDSSPTLGKDVCATAGGTVVTSGWSGYGNYVVIDHGNGVTSLYGHLMNEDNKYSNSETSDMNKVVHVGDVVVQGQVIGHAGTTYGPGGSSTGAHLHFEIRVNGSKVNPANYADLP